MTSSCSCQPLGQSGGVRRCSGRSVLVEIQSISSSRRENRPYQDRLAEPVIYKPTSLSPRRMPSSLREAFKDFSVNICFIISASRQPDPIRHLFLDGYKFHFQKIAWLPLPVPSTLSTPQPDSSLLEPSLSFSNHWQ